ncbi:hypothetical protein [Microbacterium mangrovi]|uniref:hypothetical protein n=1 Tax=Microbacterium mangrovi TaxID=1348253 RepID=UPI00057D38E4|nr:hypothetical protein [Microbacterium mangrovi]
MSTIYFVLAITSLLLAAFLSFGGTLAGQALGMGVSDPDEVHREYLAQAIFVGASVGLATVQLVFVEPRLRRRLSSTVVRIALVLSGVVFAPPLVLLTSLAFASARATNPWRDAGWLLSPLAICIPVLLVLISHTIVLLAGRKKLRPVAVLVFGVGSMLLGALVMPVAAALIRL